MIALWRKIKNIDWLSITSYVLQALCGTMVFVMFWLMIAEWTRGAHWSCVFDYFVISLNAYSFKSCGESRARLAVLHARLANINRDAWDLSVGRLMTMPRWPQTSQDTPASST